MREMVRPADDIREEREKFIKLIAECATKPSSFSKHFLGHELFNYNADYVDSNEQYILYRSGRQSGKTQSTAVKAVHFAFFAPLLKDTITNECTIVIAAPTQNQAGIMFGRIKNLITNSEILAPLVLRITQTELEVRWLNGKGISKIVTRAAGEEGITLRGYSPHVIIIDECAFIKRKIIISFLPSGLATNASVWLTSTPYGKNSYFYEKHLDARPNNAKGLWREFHIKSTDNPLVAKNPLFLEEIKNLTQEEYMQEVEGEFLDIGNALFPRQMLIDAISDARPMGFTRMYMGVDVARTGRDETVYTVIEVDDNDTIFVVEQKAEAQSNLVDVAKEIGYFYKKYPQMENVFVDETALGGGVIDISRDMGLTVTGVPFTNKEKVEMYMDLRLFFENKKIKIRNIGKLFQQLTYMKREYTEVEQRIRITSDAKDDYCDSLALACKALSTGDTWHLLDVGKGMRDAIFG